MSVPTGSRSESAQGLKYQASRPGPCGVLTLSAVFPENSGGNSKGVWKTVHVQRLNRDLAVCSVLALSVVLTCRRAALPSTR